MHPGVKGEVILVRAIAGLVGLALLLMLPEVAALAAVQARPRPSPIYQPGSVPVGADVSYPQCGHHLPFGQAFGIVGVNGGRASTFNPCLAKELAWAAHGSTEDSLQPALSVYLNTGDPGSTYLGQTVPDWPDSGVTPLGPCLPTGLFGHLPGLGQTSAGCAYLYGYQRAEADLAWLSAAASRAQIGERIRSVPVWLDVETSNTWQASPELNLVDLQGMVAALQAAGVRRIGAYGIAMEWLEITGGTQDVAGGSIFALPSWLLGAGSLAQAQSNCQSDPLSGGEVEITQFPLPNVDGDYAC
ncbi:MAG: hypothetical protein WBA31_10355 [Candidatus Dormiibacterota bacterium]